MPILLAGSFRVAYFKLGCECGPRQYPGLCTLHAVRDSSTLYKIRRGITAVAAGCGKDESSWRSYFVFFFVLLGSEDERRARGDRFLAMLAVFFTFRLRPVVELSLARGRLPALSDEAPKRAASRTFAVTASGTAERACVNPCVALLNEPAA